ncbi:MAG: FMN-binding protein [Ignavibacteriales bacterium]
MKKKTKIILLIILCIVVLGYIIMEISMSKIEKNLEGLKNTSIANIDISKLDDGVYQGEYEMFPIKVLLEVTIDNQKITNIEIIEHQNGKGGNAEAITDDVIEGQSLQVDTISGATYSSKAILKAIENALTK